MIDRDRPALAPFPSAKRVFISYRRSDSGGHAGRLHDRLVEKFGERRIFFDTSSIDAGEDFTKRISDELEHCCALIAVIGRDWLHVTGRMGERRLDSVDDYVRIEIATALSRAVPVIPVLVGGASMPHREELPRELEELSKRNALELRDSRWLKDAENLVDQLLKMSETNLGFQVPVFARDILASPRLTSIERFSLPLRARCDSDTLDFADVIESRPRLVVQGPPGAGKSVFLLRTLRKRALELVDPVEVDSRLMIPIYIEMATLEGRDLASTLVSRLHLTDQSEPSEVLAGLLSDVDFLLLLDGLNEVPKEKQTACIRSLLDLLGRLGAMGHENHVRVTMTTRSYGMSAGLDYLERNGFTIAEVLPITREEIVHELSQALGVDLEQAEQLVRQIDVKLRHLLANPQHLDYVIEWCRDARHRGEQLISGLRSVGRLLEYCVGKRMLALPDLARHAADAALRRLGNLRDDGGVAFNRAQVRQILKEEATGQDSADSLLNQMFDARILIDGDGCYRFYHHSIQQYFTAKRMMEEGHYERYTHNELFHEPLAIMAGLLESIELKGLLRRIQDDRLLLAYVLSSVDEPELDREFLEKTAADFVDRINGAGRTLFRLLIVLIVSWAALLIGLSVGILEPRLSAIEPWLTTAGAIALISGPYAISRWHRRRSNEVLSSLRIRDLPQLLSINRLLRREGVVEEIHGRLVTVKDSLQWQLGFCEVDPRLRFISDVVGDIRKCSHTVSLLTEDEKINAIADPWAAASIDISTLEPSHVGRLCEMALSSTDHRSAIASAKLLRQVYIVRTEFRGDIAIVFRSIAEDERFPRDRTGQAVEYCHSLQIEFDRGSRTRRSSRWIERLLRWLRNWLPGQNR